MCQKAKMIKRKNKCKNEPEPSPDVAPVSKRQKVAPQVSNAASAAKLMKKTKITEESNAAATAKQKPLISVTPNVPGGAKQMESSSGQKGYQMPKSFGECVVDEWFTRKHENSFSNFLKTLNETEVSVVYEMLLCKGNLSGSSG